METNITSPTNIQTETNYLLSINKLFIHLMCGEYPHNIHQFVLFHDKNDGDLLDVILEARERAITSNPGQGLQPLHVFSYTNEYGNKLHQIWFLKEWNEHKERVEKYTQQRSEQFDKERSHSHRHDKCYMLLCKVFSVEPFSKGANERELGKQAAEFNNKGAEFLQQFFGVFVMAGVIQQSEIDKVINEEE